MAELDPFRPPAGAPSGPALGNRVVSAGEEDPAAAFLAQQESEIAGIENDEAFTNLDGGAPGPQPHGKPPGGPDAVDGVMNGKYYLESNGPTDSYAAIAQVGRLQSEPESIRKWREEQTEPLEALDASSRKQEAEWKEKAIKELEEWYARQDEQLQKTKANNRAAEEAFVNDIDELSPGTEWEWVARLCDFNPKSSKQAKDVSRMRSVLISLKQAPLVH
ncbi:PREDICTED: clathrin light chain A-like isoform X1 [Odobenus rosmarus divergens]|uniref:Clathrin light chain n=1 Tax=Odobenus rosmarus divergens TaxID=9708 RepID=A0A2U3WWW1_ODORO|nr:PREDICTED: clathrin light chain A-like isoform X1 [Odobenus rosmarus divergens]